MLTFDVETIGDRTYCPRELIFTDCLKVAAIDAKLNEKRLSAFLGHMLDDPMLPLSMTAQERYYFQVKYVERQGGTLLGIDMDFSKVYLSARQPWQTELTQNGITVRQLIGKEAEFLESKCTNSVEWIVCMMALQLAYADHETLAVLPDRAAEDAVFEQQFNQRLTVFKNMPQSEFEICYDHYAELDQQLYSLIRLNISNMGLVVERGADDAPVRFCPSAAFIRLFKRLDESFA